LAKKTQCCSADSGSRPNAEDAWDWLDSIIDDMDKAAGIDTPIKDIDLVDFVVAKAKAVKPEFRHVVSPKASCTKS